MNVYHILLDKVQLLNAQRPVLMDHKTKNVKAYRGATDAKLDILTNGPIETGFIVY
jgi:hypothetical protein